MTRFALPLLIVLWALPSFAQASRTWVSGVGDDAFPCSRTAPCKTFAGAISKTAAAGEINVLDPAGVGAVTVTKSITLDGSNTLTGVLAAGTPGVIINAAATDTVVLRGLDLNGAGTGTFGIRILKARTVVIEDCKVYGFQDGLKVESNAGTNVIIKNASFHGNSASNILAFGGSMVVTRSSLAASPVGLWASGGSRVTLQDSTVFDHSSTGITASHGAEVNIERSVIAGNELGILGNAKVRISETMLSHNVTGISGTVDSYGNNRLNAGNITHGAPSGTLSQQ